MHEHGAKIFGQLTHGGHTSLQRPPGTMWAPTQMPEPSSVHNTKAMDLADIEATIAGFAASAANAREGGFDGVEIKVAHDGLLRSFASPFFNRRTDRYGGSFENRMRLSVEVVEAMKRAAGADFPVGVRICLNEYTPWGYGLDYGLEMARHLEATGCVDYFNCDAGSFSSFWMEIPPMAVPVGSFRDLNAALKKASSLPVVAFGRIKGASLAAEIVSAGEADLIGWARQLIADPETPNKLREGRSREIRYCTSCNDACVYQVVQDRGIRCIHNPDAGNETAFTLRTMAPAPRPQDGRRGGWRSGGTEGRRDRGAQRPQRDAVRANRPARRAGAACRAPADASGDFRGRQPPGTGSRAAWRHGASGRSRDPRRTPGPRSRYRRHCDRVRTQPSAAPDGWNLPTTAVESRGARPSGSDRDSRDWNPTASSLPMKSSSGNMPLGRKVLVVDGNGHWEAAGTVEYLADAGFEVEVATGGRSRLGPTWKGPAMSSSISAWQRRASASSPSRASCP